MPHASDETLDAPAPQVRHIVFAVAPELVLLDACGPLEAF
ncbi:MAG: AraC family transcriptional regulator, partial [Paraburkholderia hospita]